MNGYSEDLRRRIVSAVGGGMSKTQVARTFDVSLSSVKRYVKKANHGESLTPRKSPGSPRSWTRRPGSNWRTTSKNALCRSPGPLRLHRDRDGALDKPLYHVSCHSPGR